MVEPTGKQIKEFMNQPDEGPFVMVNLLKFKESAVESSKKGEDIYNRYAMNIEPIIKEIGARVLWIGSVKQIFIGTEDNDWDRVMLVEYPSRQAFKKMISMPEYLAANNDRVGGLEKAVLLVSNDQNLKYSI